VLHKERTLLCNRRYTNRSLITKKSIDIENQHPEPSHMSSFKDLEIYQMAFDLAFKVHHASLKLPQFELYEIESKKFKVKSLPCETLRSSRNEVAVS